MMFNPSLAKCKSRVDAVDLSLALNQKVCVPNKNNKVIMCTHKPKQITQQQINKI